jgi:hypothetical protein
VGELPRSLWDGFGERAELYKPLAVFFEAVPAGLGLLFNLPIFRQLIKSVEDIILRGRAGILEFFFGESIRRHALGARFPPDIGLDFPENRVVPQAGQALQPLFQILAPELGDVHIDVETDDSLVGGAGGVGSGKKVCRSRFFSPGDKENG